MFDALTFFGMFLVIGGVSFLILFWILEGIPKWLENLIFPAKFIPEEERITVEDVASQEEWLLVGEQSIKKGYNSGREKYLIQISINRNGKPLLEMKAGTLRSSRQYHRYKPIEKVVLAAYKMIVNHHNLSSNDPHEFLKRANSVIKEERDGDRENSEMDGRADS